MSVAFKRSVQFGVRLAGRRGLGTQARAAGAGQGLSRPLKVAAVGCVVAGTAAWLTGRALNNQVYAASKGGAPKPDIHLYWASGSPPCWRVMIVLEEKGFSDYPNTLCSMSNKEHKSAEILAINPRGQMPTMKVGSVALNESLGAIDYFEMLYKDQGTVLYPVDDAEKLATVLQRKNELLNLHKKGVEDFIHYIYSDKKSDEELQKRAEGLRNELVNYEGYLGQQQKAGFLAGSCFSMADVVFFPYLALFVRMGLRLDERFPNLKEYYERLSKRPSIQKTWPPHWKEGPPTSDILKVV